MTKELPSPELLRKLLKYEPDTGKLFWERRPVEMFVTEGAFKKWNPQFSGKEAFTANRNGYKIGSILNIGYYSHRVIWAIVHGEWPKDQIDHINGDRSDNRLINIREATSRDNNRNTSISRRNTSGVVGVTKCSHGKKWRATIKVNRKTKNIGSFDTKDAAAKARKEAEIKYGFHENHGRTMKAE